MQAERPAYLKVICLFSWPLDVLLDAVDAMDVVAAAAATATVNATATTTAAAVDIK